MRGDGDDDDNDDDYDALFKGFDWNDLMSRKLTAPVRAPCSFPQCCFVTVCAHSSRCVVV